MKRTIQYSFLIMISLAALQSCMQVEDEYTYGKNLYPIDWDLAADSATSSLVTHFWDKQNHYFIYNADQFKNAPANNYWPQAHAMDVVVDAYLRTNDKKYSDMFGQWFEGVKQMNYTNRGRNFLCQFYDDTEWIGLTMVRLYNVTKDQKYLAAAEDIMAYVTTAWNDLGGGGLAWAVDHLAAKNSCSNAPAAILAAGLHRITRKKDYLDWAVKIYDWQKTHLFNQANGCVYDGLNGETGELNTTSLSYNQGTFLGAAHQLYLITKDKSYLQDARKAAYYGIMARGNIDASNNVLRNEGDGDGGLFKGIFMRYFTALILEPDLDPVYTNKFTTFLKNNAEVLWRNGVNKNLILFGPDWTSAVSGKVTQLTSQTSGSTLIEMRAFLEKNKRQ